MSQKDLFRSYTDKLNVGLNLLKPINRSKSFKNHKLSNTSGIFLRNKTHLVLLFTTQIGHWTERYTMLQWLCIWVMGSMIMSVADPGFPVGGGADLVGGRQLPRRLRFEKFVCQNERIWTRRGARAGGAPPGSATECNHGWFETNDVVHNFVSNVHKTSLWIRFR